MMKTFEALSEDGQALVKEMADAARGVLKEHGIAPKNDDDASRFDEACAAMLVKSRNGAASALVESLPARQQVLSWHLFRVDAHDDDGRYVYLVSAESGSALKAQEMAEAAVIEDTGTASAPGQIDGVTPLGMTDSDIFQKVGPQ
ncbi:MAG: hypothetical protein E6R08_00645 [Nevskiaceae bacterium]|nr:MAG: hypothetical protein E6R08_00645 [Nevskiaceae bacterium]